MYDMVKYYKDGNALQVFEENILTWAESFVNFEFVRR